MTVERLAAGPAHRMQLCFTRSCCTTRRAVGGEQYSMPRSNLRSVGNTLSSEDVRARVGQAVQSRRRIWQPREAHKPARSSTRHAHSQAPAWAAAWPFCRRCSVWRCCSQGHSLAGQALVMVGMKVSEEPVTVRRLQGRRRAGTLARQRHRL